MNYELFFYHEFYELHELYELFITTKRIARIIFYYEFYELGIWNLELGIRN